MARLSKRQSRQRWAELRDLWNGFDPIGVMHDRQWPRDEYEGYVGRTMRLLEQDAGVEEIMACLEWAVCERMCLDLDRQVATAFAHRLQGWFRDKWAGTRV